MVTSVMTDYSVKRRLVRFLQGARLITDVLGLLLILIFFIYFLPRDLLRHTPASGGDMGSHYWPLVGLVKHGLPNFTVRVWNPGNLGGEPQLINYFPFPYLLMAALSMVLPLGMAFNWGTLLPLLFLPFTVYWCLRGLGFKFPTPLFGAAISLCFLYNESYSMWGGNTLSTLAGQFAHAYGLCLLFLGLGMFAQEIRARRWPIGSSFCFAAMATSHAYVALGFPFLVLSVVLFARIGTFRQRFVQAVLLAIFVFLLIFWFVVPLLSNASWTTAFSIVWRSGKLLEEAIPTVFFPVIAVLVSGLLCLSAIQRQRFRAVLKFTGFWMLPIAAYLGFYFVFPALGLVDVRAIPQIELFVCVLAAIVLGATLQGFGQVFAWMMTMPIVLFWIWWTNLQIRQYPGWLEYNYSGWTTKPLYQDLNKLAGHLKGNFSQPRVVYENSMVNDGAGTIRVFEMLPYFSGRATLESTYLQATILAPMAFRITAEISKTPSCPFAQYDCPSYDIERAKATLSLMGVGELILTTPEVLVAAKKSSYLEETGIFGPWHLFQLKPQPGLVDVFNQPPKIAEKEDWKRTFYDWFSQYDGSQAFLVSQATHDKLLDNGLIDSINSNIWSGAANCFPEVKVEFNQLQLKTSCPGRAHYLKFAYHPTWQADSGDLLFNVSPGFIGIVPSASEVQLRFGQSWFWKVADIISACTAMSLLGGSIWWRVKRKQRQL